MGQNHSVFRIKTKNKTKKITPAQSHYPVSIQDQPGNVNRMTMSDFGLT